MEQIEKLLGKKIIRIETNDLDDMEEVCCCLFSISGVANWQAENEKGVEVIMIARLYWNCTLDMYCTRFCEPCTRACVNSVWNSESRTTESIFGIFSGELPRPSDVAVFA